MTRLFPPSLKEGMGYADQTVVTVSTAGRSVYYPNATFTKKCHCKRKDRVFCGFPNLMQWESGNMRKLKWQICCVKFF